MSEVLASSPSIKYTASHGPRGMNRRLEFDLKQVHDARITGIGADISGRIWRSVVPGQGPG
ncbi:hypothetical protein [Nonomuraea sp. NPDC049695]|uniref:hypothetical protein n=1 Tax=Nonomuraea sp. NPDC049695 TaxID=3154734 RepID=UPI00344660A8